MKRSLRNRITSLGLSYTKEMMILIIIEVVLIATSVALYFINKKVLVLVFGGAGTLIVGYLYISRYSSLENKRKKEHVDELISLLSYFELFISNKNNVYNSFKMLLPYSSIFMDEAINSLLNQIDVDKSVGPYITFASKFENRIVESLMLSIYQMVDNGENSAQFNEFAILFNNIEKDYQTAKIEDKKRKLESLDSLPLMGAGAITIILAMSILSIVGELINVI